VPRARAAIRGPNSGTGVLEGRAHVINSDNEDVTDSYLIGARKTLELIHEHDIHVAILKENSPSCGSHHIYNSEFTQKISGMGTTAAYLNAREVKIFSEDEIDEALLLAEQLATSS